MTPPAAIRRAAPADAETVGVLVHALLVELSGGIDRTSDDVAQTARQLLLDNQIEAVLACADQTAIGVLTLNPCAAIYAGGAFGEICELYVVPERRSSGIAPLLLSETQVIARERGWSRLEVGAPDQPAWNRTVDFYLREGFQVVGPRLKHLL